MSKNKRMTRKRCCKLLAAEWKMQAREVRDDVREAFVEPILRAQEKMNTAQHRKERAE